jgi:hypothetical protein
MVADRAVTRASALVPPQPNEKFDGTVGELALAAGVS